MPTSFSYIVLRLFTLMLLLLQSLQNCYRYFYHCYLYYHTTLLLNTLLQILSYPGVVELTTQLLILENILWLPLCRINKFGLNTLPSKAGAIPYTCGLSVAEVGEEVIVGEVVAASSHESALPKFQQRPPNGAQEGVAVGDVAAAEWSAGVAHEAVDGVLTSKP